MRERAKRGEKSTTTTMKKEALSLFPRRDAFELFSPPIPGSKPAFQPYLQANWCARRTEGEKKAGVELGGEKSTVVSKLFSSTRCSIPLSITHNVLGRQLSGRGEDWSGHGE